MEKYLQLISKYRSAIMGFAILWIMFFHYPGKTNIAVLDAIKFYGYGGVDIFLFLSGFGLYFSVSKKDFTLEQYYKKRFMRILPVFWLYLLVLFIISMDYSLKSFWELLCCATTLGYWVGVIPYKLWYISCILFFYAIFPFYYKMYKKHGNIISVVVIVIGFVLVLLYALIMFFMFGNKNEGGMLILTISRIPIFFIGAIFGQWTKDGCEIQLTKSSKVLMLGLFVIGVFLLLIFTKFCPAYLWTCSLFFLPFILISPLLCAILAVTFEWLPDVITRLFDRIGIISLELFMAHVYVYQVLHKAIVNSCGSSLSSVIMVFLSFVFAIILYYINKKYLTKLVAHGLNN